MILTLNQALFLILTVTAVIVAVFAVRFLIQLRRTARQGEQALGELTTLLGELQVLERKVSARVDDMGEIIQSSKQAIAGISEVALFAATKVIRPASNYWPVLFPLLRFGWRQLKKRKERKDVGAQ